jgi:hypothetical protein
LGYKPTEIKTPTTTPITVTGTGKGIDLEELKKQRDILGKLNLKELTSIGEKEFNQNYGKKAIPTFFQDILDAGVRLKNELPKIMSGLDMSEAGMTIEEQIKKNVTARAKLALIDFNNQAKELTEQLKIDLVVNAATGLGEAIGQSIGGKGFDISNVFKSMLMTIGDYMIKLGVQSVGMQKLILLLQASFGTITGIGAAIAVTAGGAALKGLAGSLFSQTPKFANGGIVSGPTLGLMGEYAGARSNPEVIAPLSKLKDLLGGGGSAVIPDVKILGEDIYISFNRYKKRTGNT